MEPQISLFARESGPEVLWKDGERALHRELMAYGDQPPRNVLALRLTTVHPRPTSIAQIAHEFELKDHLDSAWSARPIELVPDRDRTILILEDPGGETLDRHIGKPMSIPQFLRLGISTAAALSHAHQRGLVHKDLKPIHILVNQISERVCLTGFGHASRLPRERQALSPPEFIAGTLAYMAPEQTGRMNRSIDSRSDLYSLGVVFYEMLAGVLPFTTSDPLELIHCHIARTPSPLCERVANIPGPISDIVTKLLAKTADERYQTATGVEHDLQRCLSQWQAAGKIVPFTIGARDTPDRLMMPEKLYGRDIQIASLLNAYGRVATTGATELVIISGYSGIGKSSVVNEMNKAILSSRGLFASGKFEQEKRDIPYATVAQAFQRLIRSFLGKGDSELAGWRRALREAVGSQGQHLVELMPELKLVIGEQPPAPDLPLQQAQQAFQIAFRGFVGVFATEEHPLVLFLDDLHWVDAASLDLLEDLMTRSELRYLLVIGAYRDNEVDLDHPLPRKLEAIQSTGLKVEKTKLTPLSRKHLEELVMDAFHCVRARAVALARILFEKTAGNPFFVMQFLSALVDEGVVEFDRTIGGWTWDPEGIRSKLYTENVVELMVGKLAQLSTVTQSALLQLACLGTAASTAMLATVLSRSEDHVHAALWDAVRRNFIEKSDDSYRFIHDRIHEAAYSLIPHDKRIEMHLHIGRVLVLNTPSSMRDELIFDIVNQLNRGTALIFLKEEQEQLAEFNLIAGRRARASAAFLPALNYFATGASLLAAQAWVDRHELAFALEFYQAECDFLIGQKWAAEERLTTLSVRAGSTLERATVACLRIDLYTTLDQCDKAVDICIEYLGHLGVNWSPHPTRTQVKREYGKIWKRIGDRTVQELVDLPLMKDAVSLGTLDVLTRIFPSALFTDANLLSLAICRAINLSLDEGHGDGSCVAYVFFGKIAGPQFGDYKAGFAFGHLGYELVDRPGLERFRARAYLWFAQFSLTWTRHVSVSRALIWRAFETAKEAGDLTFTVYSFDNLNTNFLAAGDPLEETQRQAERGLELAVRAKYDHIIDLMKAQMGVIRCLRGLTYKFGSFDDGQVSEFELERRYAANSATKQPECWYWIRKLQVRFFAGEYSTALACAARARELLWTSAAMFETAEYHFYAALSLAAFCNPVLAKSADPTSHSSKRPGALEDHCRTLVAHHRQLELWAENCPENFENRAALVGAELARLEGRYLEAEQLYEQAIRSARVNGFFHNEAIAYETAARFYSARGFEDIAEMYLSKARDGYLRWGALGKVRQLEADHLRLNIVNRYVGSSDGATPAKHLDLAAVLKASQALSSEILLPRLVEQLMTIALQSAGADRGLLILPRQDDYVVEAEARIVGDGIVLQYGHSTELVAPETILRYVMRTQEAVILDDATKQHLFSVDPYMTFRNPRSVLCLPLVRQGVLGGMLYLENTLASHAFTSDRITLLELLGTQAAISLENTRLYSDLQEREARVQRLFNANIIGIFTWDLNGRITDANDAFLRIIGYRREDLESGSLRWKSLMPDEWDPQDDRIMDEMRATGAATSFEGAYVKKDGTRVPVLIGAALFDMRSTEGVAFVVDLTDRQLAEEKARESERRYHETKLALAHVNRVTTMGHLAASIAHELSQPISGVVVSAETALLWLGEAPNVPEAQKAIARVVRDGTRAGQVFSRIRTLVKKAPSLKSILDINEVILETISLTHGEAIKSGVSIEMRLNERLPLILGDRVQLQQVVLNLIMNALDAIKGTGDTAGEIRVSSAVTGSGEVHVSVQDSGPGIDPANLERIFGAFYTTKADGLGMGLSICRSIIEAHGGKLWATMVQTRGVIFHFVVPVEERSHARQ
ncbi:MULTISPECIES: ATP-binding sensor histidine kinase [unclassified Mesorhizobium]|uniref:trifunctional serine/threonine-protein kinase/ATP-binding protein/sensor histidine kinase n=1 Tax=unclassified Mesorhizobium TaxID=325217 RepID=UPI0003CEDBF0|nr:MULTISPECIES: ATP-binding sensor histidine kinase [unclassified Mesorhizobium]ESY51358.1 protein kinase [Mesorhizobium sp. LNJC374B00]ESY56686.1 protein kinase [Mesorhizobium sp. LNJC372A00]WJI81970.1 AAA family ATPase [Mesorhizobium sp. C374B]WJI88489.1 AAA family ATPase [Mesorhizobium sp. C372A]